MKIRNGFVSNSSSSSFIISDEYFKTSADLAKYMINIQIEEDADFLDKEWIEHKLKLIDKLKNIDEDLPISFPSCNYDTYIRKVGDCYLVSTCNNTRWELYDYSTQLTENAITELKKLIGKHGDDSTIEGILEGDYYDFPHIGINYYDLNSEIIGVEVYDSCPNCDTYMWNTVKHGKICLKCNKVYKRKEKLEKIEKNN